MGMIENWKSVLTQPKETFAKRKKEADFMAAMKPYAIVGGVIGLLIGVAVALFAGILSLVPGLGILVGLGFLAIPVLAIGVAVLEVIASLVMSALMFVFAKLLGGSGDFKTHYFLPSLYVIPVAVLTIVLNVIPFIGPLLGFVLAIYSLYLMTLSLKETHGFGTGKAILVWLLPVILAIVLAVLFAGATIAALMAASAASRAA